MKCVSVKLFHLHKDTWSIYWLDVKIIAPNSLHNLLGSFPLNESDVAKKWVTLFLFHTERKRSWMRKRCPFSLSHNVNSCIKTMEHMIGTDPYYSHFRVRNFLVWTGPFWLYIVHPVYWKDVPKCSKYCLHLSSINVICSSEKKLTQSPISPFEWNGTYLSSM